MPTHKTLTAALCAAQAEMPNAVFDSVNPHFKNKYASLKSLREASLKILAKHGLAIVHVQDVDPIRGYHLRGELRHDATPETIPSFFLLPDARDKPQIVKSAVTYGTRTTWGGLIGIASEEDDDGEGATITGKAKSSLQAKKDGDWAEIWEPKIAEIEAIQTTANLRAWGITNGPAITEAPKHWGDLVRDAYKYRLKDLGGTEGPPSTLIEDLKASHKELDQLEAEDEDITTTDPAAYLDDIDGAMAGAKDVATVLEIWKEHEAIKGILSPADQEKAEVIFHRHQRRAQADAAVKGFKRPGG